MAAQTSIAADLLVRGGQILLGHRHPLREWYPDCWDLIGGHVEPGESPRQAVIRECYEELGVRIVDPAPIPMACSDPTLEMHAFLITTWDGEPVNLAPEEHDDVRWFLPSELVGLLMADPSALPDILNAIPTED